MSDAKLHRLIMGQTTEPHCSAEGNMATRNPVMKTRGLCAQVLRQRGLPLENRVIPADFDPSNIT